MGWIGLLLSADGWMDELKKRRKKEGEKICVRLGKWIFLCERMRNPDKQRDCQIARLGRESG